MGEPSGRPRVVVVGAGFGGLRIARSLRREPVDVTVVDKRNHHLFQPLLYQVATAGLAPTDIAAPIRNVLRGCDNCRVLLARATEIDVRERVVRTAEGEAVPYDKLVLAVGMTNGYFGHEEWERDAPGLKSLEEALEIRRRVLLAYENAERATTEEERRANLTFVVIGGGATGVELAGALAEIARRTMTRDFRSFDPQSARVVLLEGGPRLLPAFPTELSERVRADLQEIGVEVRLGVRAEKVDGTGVRFDGERIDARTTLWAAGVRGVPLAESLGVPLDRQGRIPVEDDLRVKGLDDVFAIGDIAALRQDGELLPGVAQVALQQGVCAAENVMHAVRKQPLAPFRYRDLGTMATIGRSRAVAVLGNMRLTGFVAWCAWLFVHLMALVGFRNRVIVLVEWAWAYFSYQRSARIILDRDVDGPTRGT